MRPVTKAANCGYKTQPAALLDAVGVLALVVDDAVGVPGVEEVDEARLFEAASVAVVDEAHDSVHVAEDATCVNPPAAASDEVEEWPRELSLDVPSEPPSGPPGP